MKIQTNNFLLSKFDYLKVFYFILFYIFVTPYYIGIDNQGISANYLFVFFPLIILFIKKEIIYPPTSVVVFMLALGFIFIFGSIFQAEQYDLLLRRSASFAVFMSIFSLMFVKIDSYMIQSFKLAIVAWSLFESSVSILEFISIDGNSLGFYAKGQLGTQRIGFIYLMGFWLVAMLKVQANALKIIKFLMAYIVVVGIFLTYTRSTLFAFAVSITVYFVYLAITLFKGDQGVVTFLSKMFSKFLYIAALLILVVVFFRGSVQYYSNTIFKYIFSTQDSYSQSAELNLYTSWTVYVQENEHIKGKIIAPNLLKLETKLRNKFEIGKDDNIPSNLLFINPIITRVARSREAGLAQQDLYKAKENLITATSVESNVQIQNSQALQEKYKLGKANNYSDIASKNKIHQKYVDKKKIDYLQSKVSLSKSQLNLTLSRLLTLELQKLLSDTKKQLKIAKNQVSIREIDQKIYDIKSQILILNDKYPSLNKGSVVGLRINDTGTSIGYRVFMHKKVLDKTYQSPLIGSAFLGVWTLFDNKSGSAHSQYLDVLFRVGVIAFIVYLFFLFKVSFFLYKRDIGLFLGFVGFLCFGIFHETIKLSQGSFIFAFLFAMWAQRQHLLKSSKK